MKYNKYFPFIIIGFISLLLNLFLHSIGAFSLIETKLYDYRFKLFLKLRLAKSLRPI